MRTVNKTNLVNYKRMKDYVCKVQIHSEIILKNGFFIF